MPGMIVLPATLMVRVPAGTVREPRRPTAATRLLVTSTSPCGITSSPFIVIMRAPVSSTEPVGFARGSSTTTSVFCGSVDAIGWRKNCAPQAQVTAEPSAVQSR